MYISDIFKENFSISEEAFCVTSRATKRGRELGEKCGCVCVCLCVHTVIPSVRGWVPRNIFFGFKKRNFSCIRVRDPIDIRREPLRERIALRPNGIIRRCALREYARMYGERRTD